MKIIILTSVYPYENMGKAGNITLFEILKQLLKKKIDVKVLFASNIKIKNFSFSNNQLKKFGKIELLNFSSIIKLKKRKFFEYLFKIFRSFKEIEDFKLEKEQILNQINYYKPDRIIFFWDTILDSLIEDLQNYETIYYGAKPPFSAFENSIEKQNNLKKIINIIILKKRKKIHFSRIKKMKKIFNISKLDSLYYESKKINVNYLQNTSKDKYEDLWRQTFKKKHKKIKILGNISDLNATGNFQGLSFINDKLFPLISDLLISKNIKIVISGKGKINPVFKNILNSKVFEIKGYVKNFENLILSSDIILMMNNSGSYTGGYTRIVDFFSSGSCVIAHKNLKRDMPEVENLYNILLGSNELEIRDHLCNCINNFSLRKNIGINARKTFEKYYHSKSIVSKLIE